MAKKTPWDMKKPVEKNTPAKAKTAVAPVAEKSTLAKAKTAVAHAAEKVVEVVTHVAEAAQEHVVAPVAEAVGISKKKTTEPKARVARIRTPVVRTKTPVVPATPLPPRSRTASGMMMSKNLSLPPKEEPTRGTKPKPKR